MVIPRDSSYLYAAFLSKPESKEDVAMIPTGGLITYDKISREYQIANFEKLTERSLPGNYTSLNTKTCKIETEGVFTLADDISHFEVKPAGNFVYNTISNENEMNLILTTDFKMDKGIMEVLTKELQESEMFSKELVKKQDKFIKNAETKQVSKMQSFLNENKGRSYFNSMGNSFKN